MIRTTLTAMPRRLALLAAKATIVAAVSLAAGAVAVLASVVAGRLLLPADSAFGGGAALRAAAGSVLYLGLIALLALGVGAAVRDSAVAIGIVLCLLFVLPLAVLLVSDPDWQRRLWLVSPANAGLAIQTTRGLSALPLSPWAGLGVLAGWAGAALLGGGLLLRWRDA